MKLLLTCIGKHDFAAAAKLEFMVRVDGDGPDAPSGFAAVYAVKDRGLFEEGKTYKFEASRLSGSGGAHLEAVGGEQGPSGGDAGSVNPQGESGGQKGQSPPEEAEGQGVLTPGPHPALEAAMPTLAEVRAPQQGLAAKLAAMAVRGSPQDIAEDRAEASAVAMAVDPVGHALVQAEEAIAAKTALNVARGLGGPVEVGPQQTDSPRPQEPAAPPSETTPEASK